MASYDPFEGYDNTRYLDHDVSDYRTDNYSYITAKEGYPGISFFITYFNYADSGFTNSWKIVGGTASSDDYEIKIVYLDDGYFNYMLELYPLRDNVLEASETVFIEVTANYPWNYDEYKNAYDHYEITILNGAPLSTVEEIEIDKNLAAALAEGEYNNSKMQQEVEFLQAQLDLEKQKIEGLSDQQKAEWALQVLKTLKAAGELAGLGLGVTGTGAVRTGLIEALRTLQGVTGADKLATEIAKTFKDPSLDNLSATASAMASLLVRAKEYRGSLNDLFNVSKTVKSLEEFYSGSQSFWKQNGSIENSIDDANRKIDALQQKINDLKNAPIGNDIDYTPSTNFLTISNGSNSIKFLLNDTVDVTGGLKGSIVNNADSVTNYIYGKNDQALTVSSGNLIIDGGGVTGEDLIVNRSLASTRVEFGSDGLVRLTGTGFSALLLNVDSLRFKDALIGGSRNDVLKSTGVFTNLLGGDGGDRLIGSKGSNQLSGNEGNDTIIADAGADILNGGFGKDKLSGGTGNDVFVFNALFETGRNRANADEITDFSKGDKIKLADIDADVKAAGNQSFSFIGTKKFSGHEGELRTEKFGKSLMVYGDVDGDSISDFAIIVNGISALKSSDFFL